MRLLPSCNSWLDTSASQRSVETFVLSVLLRCVTASDPFSNNNSVPSSNTSFKVARRKARPAACECQLLFFKAAAPSALKIQREVSADLLWNVPASLFFTDCWQESKVQTWWLAFSILFFSANRYIISSFDLHGYRCRTLLSDWTESMRRFSFTRLLVWFQCFWLRYFCVSKSGRWSKAHWSSITDEDVDLLKNTAEKVKFSCDD